MGAWRAGPFDVYTNPGHSALKWEGMMRGWRGKTLGIAAALGLALGGAPASTEAQVAWDGPFLVAPGSPAGLGVFLVDPAPGRGIGLLATWRGSAAPGGLGYRFGLAEDRSGDLSVYGGVDFSGVLIRHSDEIPIDIAWIAGGGLGLGSDVLLSIPFGVALGRELQADGLSFNPYFAPRVVLDARFGDRDGRRESAMELRLAADLGFDVAFDPNWAIRFAASFGDRTALGIGASFRVF